MAGEPLTVEVSADVIHTVTVEDPQIGTLEVEDPTGPTAVEVSSPGAVTVVTAAVMGPPGPQGIQGPVGPAANAAYVHIQGSPSVVWTINHGLGFRPNVTVIDTIGRLVLGELSHPSANQTVMVFSASFGGTAYCS